MEKTDQQGAPGSVSNREATEEKKFKVIGVKQARDSEERGTICEIKEEFWYYVVPTFVHRDYENFFLLLKNDDLQGRKMY